MSFVVQSLSGVRLFSTSWTASRQVSLSFTNSWSLLKLMSVELVMPSNHLILCCALLLLPSIFPRIRAFSNERPAGTAPEGLQVSLCQRSASRPLQKRLFPGFVTQPGRCSPTLHRAACCREAPAPGIYSAWGQRAPGGAQFKRISRRALSGLPA